MVSENNRIKSAQPDDLNCGLEREVGTCAVDGELESLGPRWAARGRQ